MRWSASFFTTPPDRMTRRPGRLLLLVLIFGAAIALACGQTVASPSPILSSTAVMLTFTRTPLQPMPSSMAPDRVSPGDTTVTVTPVLSEYPTITPPGTTVPPQPPLPSSTRPPQTVVPPLAGVEIHSISDVDSVANMGAYWVRRNALFWSQVEPSPGERDWSAVAALDAELQAIAARGMQTILIVHSAPPWAQKLPGVYCGPVAAEQLDDYAAFLRDAVARYSQLPYNVKYWELGNEPDVNPALVPPDSLFGCWGDPSTPGYGGEYYAEMLKVVYPQIKAADPQAQVLVGGLLLDCDPYQPPEQAVGSGTYKDCSSSMFLDGILQNGGGPYFDGVSFHAYDYYYESKGMFGNLGWHSGWDTTGPSLSAKAGFLHSLLQAHGYPEKYLMGTEVALLCSREEDDPVCLGQDFNLTKAMFAVQAQTAALVKGLHSNVWYSILGWRSSGLVDGSRQPYPVYNALRFNAQAFSLAAYRGEVTDYSGVRGYEFDRPGKRIWVLWSLDGANHMVTLPSAPTGVFDLFGNPLPAGQNLEVGVSPLYLEW